MKPFNFPTLDESDLLDDVLDENTQLILENNALRASNEFYHESNNAIAEMLEEAVSLLKEQEAECAELHERLSAVLEEVGDRKLISSDRFSTAMDAETLTENIDTLYDCVSSLTRRIYKLEMSDAYRSNF